MEKCLDLANNLKSIISKVQSASLLSPSKQAVQLIAVSKTKPIPLLQEVYQQGFYHFGENYVDEIIQKAQQMPTDIKWHFIGHLQSNKAKSLCQIPNLYAIHTIDSIKLADKVNKALIDVKREEKLKVFIQIKTSNEESKHGLAIKELSEIYSLIDHIREKTDLLDLQGLMTIGQAGDESAFDQLKEIQQNLIEKYAMDGLELSMGMSADYEMAIQKGSNYVRVGSSLFGARDYSQKKV